MPEFWHKIYMLFLMPVLLPIVLTIRLLRPLVLIRIGLLQTNRIGQFAADVEVYLCERDSGIAGPNAGNRSRWTLDIFYHAPSVSNRQLKKMWDRTLLVSRFARPVDELNQKFPGYKRHDVPMAWERDLHGLLASTPPHLTFTKEEQNQGEAGLREMGIPEGANYLYFFARDNSYLDASLEPRKSVGGWRYHDYRNSYIDNYVPAAEELSRRGYFAVRMGAAVLEGLKTTDPKIIDYATKYRSDFLDVYLGANCRFALGDTAGIYGLPTIFRRPMAFVNFIPLELAHTWNPQDLFIPKKLWLEKEERFMTFREVLESGAGLYVQSQRYEESGIQAIENTPEEIHALAMEMDERLNGTWQMTGEDEDLQRRFWSLFKSSEYHGTIRSHIGAEFLRQNQELLD